ncbi:hydrolase [Peptococcaceae bacterium 1198_IL3148]
MSKCEILIQYGNTIYQPAVEEGVVWEAQRRKAAGKLTFTVLKDAALNFTEGNAVRFTYGGEKVFYGFVFSKQRSNNDEIKVICYDQLRYFKNKDTYVYENKTATQLLRMVANDFRLKLARVADTKIALSASEDNKELFDIVGNALDETTTISGQSYVLYDEFGGLVLENISNMKLDILIDAETAQTYDYRSSIDSGTYNKIKLVYDNSETGKREVFIAQDSVNQNNWGILQYFESLNSNVNGKAKADTLLKLYNRKARSLSIKDCAGDVRVRGGSLVPIMLNLGDVALGNYMLVENVKHTFKESEHTMTVQINGGDFSA